MERRLSLEGAVYFTKLSVLFACTWPPSRQATKWQIARADALWCLSFLSILCLIVPLMNSIYEYRSDMIVVTHSMSLCFSCAMSITKTLVLRIRRKKVQILIGEMEDFLKNCKASERRVLQRYVDRCWLFHGLISFMNYLSSVSISLSPFVLPNQRMPTYATYPFSIDSGLPMYLVFIHQSIVGLQCSAALTVDCQMALMMWFAGARFQILAEEIRDSRKIKGFRYFIVQHQRILSYATRVSGTMCYIAFTTSCVCGIALVMFCLQIVSNQPLSVKLQFGPGILVCLINLMVCTWPTENMIGMCNLIGMNVYNTPWFDMSPKWTKDIVMMLRSSQRPVQVSIGGFLPGLSFRFYASFLSAVFSYFTTARLIMSDS